MDARVVVSIHDVAPPTLPGIQTLVRALDQAGARPRVLKVIPNAQGRWPLAQSQELMSFLRQEVQRGSEIVLHGYTHQVNGRLRGPLRTQLRGRLLAASSAEFLSVDPGEMLTRVQAGRAMLRDAGLDAAGFCAPGWLAPRSLDGVLRTCGFRYRIDMLALHDLAHGHHLRIPWIGYMGADEIQEGLIGVANLLTIQVERLLPVLKVFFHPVRPSTAGASIRVVDTIGTLVQRRRPVTYGELLA